MTRHLINFESDTGVGCWCGEDVHKMSPKATYWISETTCEDCLHRIIEYGRMADERMRELESTKR